jgi:MFS family permease
VQLSIKVDLFQGTVLVDDDGGSASEDSFAFRFNLLYSVYSFPNCVLPFFGGLVSDRLGVRLTGVIFMALILLGQIITSVGTTLKDADTAWYVMWLGRTVFGLGGESLSVAQSAFVGEARSSGRATGAA